MITVLIGCGPNGAEITAMVFESFEQGLEFCTAKLGRQPDYTFTKPETHHRSALWNVDEDDERMKSCFRGYYGGCGDCYRMSLREVETATPLVRWDLD